MGNFDVVAVFSLGKSAISGIKNIGKGEIKSKILITSITSYSALHLASFFAFINILTLKCFVFFGYKVKK